MFIFVKATELEKSEIENVASEERVKMGTKCSHSHGQFINGSLDAFWPDFAGSRKYTWSNGGWNNAEVDELGPIGTFALTIDNLSPNTAYVLSVRPVFYPQSNERTGAFTITAKTKAKGKFIPDYTQIARWMSQLRQRIVK